MNRTELEEILGGHGSLEDKLTDQDSAYSVYAVGQREPCGSNAVLFDIPSGVTREFEEIVKPINLRILTLRGIGRVLLHTRSNGESRQQKLEVAAKPVPIGMGQVYSYQSQENLILLDRCFPPFQDGDEIEPELASLPDYLVAAHQGGYTAALPL